MWALIALLLVVSCHAASLDAHFVSHMLNTTNMIRVANLSSGAAEFVDVGLSPTSSIVGIWRLTPCTSLVVESQWPNHPLAANLTVVDVCARKIVSRVPVASSQLPAYSFWRQALFTGSGVMYVPWTPASAKTGLAINFLNITTGQFFSSVAFGTDFPAPDELLWITINGQGDVIYVSQQTAFRPMFASINITSGVSTKLLWAVEEYFVEGLYYDTTHDHLIVNKSGKYLAVLDTTTGRSRDWVSLDGYSMLIGTFFAPPGYILFPVWHIASQLAYDAFVNDTTGKLHLPATGYHIINIVPYWGGAAAWF